MSESREATQQIASLNLPHLPRSEQFLLATQLRSGQAVELMRNIFLLAGCSNLSHLGVALAKIH